VSIVDVEVAAYFSRELISAATV